MGITIIGKGDQSVILPKTGLIKATCSWSTEKDYDLYALVLMQDGSVQTVAMFDAEGVPRCASILGGAVRHTGDVGRGAQGKAQEIIEIRLTPAIRAVVPVAYSAQSNSIGSFRKYRVSLGIDNGAGDTVEIQSRKASMNPLVYTCAIGIIENTRNGVRIHPLETYSRMNSERRPLVTLEGDRVKVYMNRGPENDYKK